MDLQKVTIKNMTFSIPASYRLVKNEEGDPADTVKFSYRTENAQCLIITKPIPKEYCMPLDKEIIINGIRAYLREDQGFIKVDAGENYAYTILKSVNQDGAVKYILSYQLHFEDEALSIIGYFDEKGSTGFRETIVLNKLIGDRKNNNAENALLNWNKDPYDETFEYGELMNTSENETYDELFPDFPLSLCRELVTYLNNL